MSISFSSNAASCSVGSPGGIRGSASFVASRHIWVAITRRLRSCIWSTLAQATPGAHGGQRAVAADGSHALAHLDPLADALARRVQHVQVDEGSADLGAPDRHVVPAAAV